MSKRKPGPRFAVVGTCTLSPQGCAGPDDLLAAGLEMVDEMAARAAESGWSLDLFFLPEHSCPTEYADVREIAETLDGRTLAAFAEKAQQHGTYGAVPVHLIEGDRVFNCVVILDRNGEPVGTYRKVFPVVSLDGRLERGVTPGSEFPVFELDFGRVGVQICFDIGFPAGWEAYGEQEAELVLHSTDPSSDLGLRGYARRQGYYAVSSTMRAPAMIVDPTGRKVACTDEDRQVVVGRFDLDYRIMPSRYSWTRGDEMRKKYGGRLVQDWSDVGWCVLLTSTDPDMPVGRIVEEEGLTTVRDWLAHNIATQDAARGGPPRRPPR